MTPLAVLLGGLAFIAIFVAVALPLGWVGGKLYKLLEGFADSGFTLAICMTAYTAFTILICIVTMGTIVGAC